MKKSYSKKKRIIDCSIIVISIISILLAGGWLLFDDNSPINRASAIECTCEWARLAPFPSSSENLTIEVTGNSFTRGFIIEFTAPRADIEKWLKDSPGTSNPKSVDRRNGSVKYEIDPSGGAVSAEVVVSHGGTRVRIDTDWS